MAIPTPLSLIVPRLSKTWLGKQASKARISMPRLLDNWTDLVAPLDANIVRPLRVSWHTDKNTNISEGTLHVAAPSAIAARILYQQAVLLERINRFFGLQESARLRRLQVTHLALSGPEKPKKPKRAGQVVLPADTQQTLETIEDPLLRDTLTRLARAMAESQQAQ